MKSEGYEKVDKVVVKEKEIVSGGLKDQDFPTVQNTIEQVGAGKVSYVAQNKSTEISNIATTKVSNMANSIESKTYNLTKPSGQDISKTALFSGNKNVTDFNNTVSFLNNVVDFFKAIKLK